MVDVLTKVNELIGLLQLRIRHYEEEARKASLATTKAHETVAAHEALQAQLAEREAAASTREATIRRIDNLTAAEEVLAGAKTAFASEQARATEALTAAQQTLKGAQDAVEAARKKLVERELTLDEDRRTYKTTVMKQLLDAGWKGPAAE